MCSSGWWIRRYTVRASLARTRMLYYWAARSSRAVKHPRVALLPGSDARVVAPSTLYADLDNKAAEVPPGCDGLVALDHFQGNRTPHTDAHSRGALVGLTFKHGRGHMFWALLE
ncbi:hypothetical protein Vretifemale_8576 [Volvox reticuliferus]|uniref:Carbohydrate kinase FGGY C-terminal domain-containing protein n=1 Tax=Volvox reticuliferus TaxID=1737510 RepID=A0A8J4FPM6_9CHLO|nr:hypothetical protein Vretifemale_8576 [Volvox reticuliferus]